MSSLGSGSSLGESGLGSGSGSGLATEQSGDVPMYEAWTFQEHKTFEIALAQYYSLDDRWERIAACLPRKTAYEVQMYFQQLEDDVMRIQTGLVPLPSYDQSLARPGQPRTGLKKEAPPGKAGPSPKKSKVDTSSSKEAASGEAGNKRKGVPWTEDEHKLFLLGLAKFGKGDWRSIARNFVQSRTPTQVASHAQKYFIRLNSTNKKDKRRASIHDITADDISHMPEMQALATVGGYDMVQRVC